MTSALWVIAAVLAIPVLLGTIVLVDEIIWRFWPIRQCKGCGSWFFLGEGHRCTGEDR